MKPVITTHTTPANTACPACGGPAAHPGGCLDGEGNILPGYTELAQLWEDDGHPALSLEEMQDFLDTYDVDDDARS